MRTLDQDSFNDLLKHTTIKPRIISELKFVKSVENLAEDWSNYELLSITDRTNEKGILLLEPATDLYAVQYELSKKVIDFKSGRRRAIICDFCYTWQSGSNAASITFSTGNSKRKVRFICCADLRCSMHVRTMTREAVMSRAQLHENMTNEDRILRLKDKLRDKITQLELTPIQAHP